MHLGDPVFDFGADVGVTLYLKAFASLVDSGRRLLGFIKIILEQMDSLLQNFIGFLELCDDFLIYLLL